MKQRKLNRKKVAFVIIVALIFILPLVAIGNTVRQITSTVHVATTSNTKTDAISPAQPVIPPGSDVVKSDVPRIGGAGVSGSRKGSVAHYPGAVNIDGFTLALVSKAHGNVAGVCGRTI